MAFGEDLKRFFMGSPSRIEEVGRFRPGQEQGINQALEQALAQLQDPTAGFDPIAQEATRSFEQQTLPSIMERLNAMGAMGGSGALQTLGSAGADLQSQLAAQKAQYGQRQQGLSQNLLGMGLTQQFDPLYHEENPGLLKELLAQAVPAAGQAFGSYLGGKVKASGLRDTLGQLSQFSKDNAGSANGGGSGGGSGGGLDLGTIFKAAMMFL